MIICGIQECNSNKSVFAFTYLPRFPSGYCQLGCTARTVTLMQFVSSLMFSKLYLNSTSKKNFFQAKSATIRYNSLIEYNYVQVIFYTKVRAGYHREVVLDSFLTIPSSAFIALPTHNFLPIRLV